MGSFKLLEAWRRSRRDFVAVFGTSECGLYRGPVESMYRGIQWYIYIYIYIL